MSTAEANARITTLAAERAVHRAFGWLHLHEPQLRRWQLEFLAIPAPPFGESARAVWFCDRFRDLGLHNPHLDAAGNALAEFRTQQTQFDLLSKSSPTPAVLLSEDSNSPSVLLSEGPRFCGPQSKDPKDPGLVPTAKPFSPTAPCVLLSAHLDTVFPAETACTPREERTRILCPGACDNGAGLTGLLALAAALKHAEIVPATTILFAANVGEEGEGDLRGMRYLFSSQSPYAGRIKTAIALEGAGSSAVVDRALGSRRLRVTVTGPGGHSWADSGRPNPIVALARCLVAVSGLQLPARPRTTLNCGTIRGGTSVNSIPESATADLDLRSTSALEIDSTELAVLNTLEAALTSQDKLHLNVTRIGDRPSGALAPSSALITSLRAVDRHLNLATESRIGSTDANLPLSLNIPALAIGCGGTGWGIHTLQEGYDPTGRDVALRRILLLLLDTASTT